MSAIDALAHGYRRRMADLDPMEAFAQGEVSRAGLLTDLSPEGEAARADLVRSTLQDLARMIPETPADRTARAAMEERLGAMAEVYEAGEWRRPLSVFGPQTAIRESFDLMPTATDRDWEVVAAKMAQVPVVLAGLRRTLDEGIREGSTSARRQVLFCARQTGVLSGAGAGAGYFTRLAGSYRGSNSALADRLSHAASGANAAYGELTSYLEGEYAPRARSEDGIGPELYPLWVRRFNGIELDLEETYRFGWDELAAIESEMAKVATRIVPGGGVYQAVELLESDPARAIEGPENFLAWNQDLLDKSVAALNGSHFDIPEPVRRVEAMLAPAGGSPAMYYTAPASDFSRPGRTWYPTQGRTRFPLWHEVTTAHHEGVPGHHLQLAQACWLGERLPPFQTILGAVSGHIEGWALYAERLMGELGFLENPDYRLGMLAAQAFRAARVVLDVGLHLGLQIPARQEFHPGERWTYELAVEFLRLKSRRPPEFCDGEVNRYLGVPGQAISYKVGERVWLEVRESARRTWGPAFNLRDFHRQALNLGCVGLGQLREEMSRPA